jgi:hypothetical protein
MCDLHFPAVATSINQYCFNISVDNNEFKFHCCERPIAASLVVNKTPHAKSNIFLPVIFVTLIISVYKLESVPLITKPAWLPQNGS